MTESDLREMAIIERIKISQNDMNGEKRCLMELMKHNVQFVVMITNAKMFLTSLMEHAGAPKNVFQKKSLNRYRYRNWEHHASAQNVLKVCVG